jgi:hypothetical protein
MAGGCAPYRCHPERSAQREVEGSAPVVSTWTMTQLIRPIVSQATLLACSLVALLIGCADGESSPPAAATPSALEDAARELAGFLAGEAELDTLRLADTVELHLPPEGAGTSTGASVRIARGRLRDRDAWRIRAGQRSFSLVPAKALTRTTVRAGTHFNCRETPLASRGPHLPRWLPVRREPAAPKSCLESWNVTFVFDTSAARPRLVAALYDQWEW